MSNASPKDAVTSGETASGLPILPATTPLAHNAIQIRIKIESVYTKEGLIEVQRGGVPPKCDEIIVVDISAFDGETLRHETAHQATGLRKGGGDPNLRPRCSRRRWGARWGSLKG